MDPLVWHLLVVLIPVAAIMGGVPAILMIERWGSAWMQRRVGPNRVGPYGTMQPLADALKLIFKEFCIPAKAHKALFILGPMLAVIPPFVAFSVIPLSGSVIIGGKEFFVEVSSLNVGLLFALAISSLHVYAILAAGWGSSNKFSLLGALRSSAQMVSYEIAIGISIVSLVLTYGTLDLREIVRLQEAGSSLPFWGMLLQPIPFLTLWICSFAETNRLPFDLPEGESELVAGYHTEYSGMGFALFFLGEYGAMYFASAFLATLFLGGYNIPFFSGAELTSFMLKHAELGIEPISWIVAALQLVSFAIKVGFFMWVFVWVRWTLPRFRYDQLMHLGWKILLPIGIVNVIATMLISYFRQ